MLVLVHLAVGIFGFHLGFPEIRQEWASMRSRAFTWMRQHPVSIPFWASARGLGYTLAVFSRTGSYQAEFSSVSCDWTQ